MPCQTPTLLFALSDLWSFVRGSRKKVIWSECISTKLYVDAPNPNVMVLGRWSGLDEVMRIEPP